MAKDGQAWAQWYKDREAKRIEKKVDEEWAKPILVEKVPSVPFNFSYQFEAAIKPMGAVRLVHSDKWAKRPAAVKYFEYKNELQKLFPTDIISENLYAIFLIPMPKSWTKKKKVINLHQPHLQKPDWDNLAKGLQDALMKDDSAVWTGCITKYWAEKGHIFIFNDLLSWHFANESIKKQNKLI